VAQEFTSSHNIHQLPYATDKTPHLFKGVINNWPLFLPCLTEYPVSARCYAMFAKCFPAKICAKNLAKLLSWRLCLFGTQGVVSVLPLSPHFVLSLQRYHRRQSWTLKTKWKLEVQINIFLLFSTYFSYE
jgi:hypothetical protein